MILAGDLGGTKTLLALCAPEALDRPIVERSFPSAAHPSFEPLLGAFLGELPAPPSAVCLAVAGPVVERRAAITNLPWVLEEARLARRLGLPERRVALANDLLATAWGMPHLPPDRIVALRPGTPDPRGAALLVAVGTGLGVALLTREEEGRGDAPAWPYRARASEGGHADLAARDDLQESVLAQLRRRTGAATIEHATGGPGLRHLYEALRDRGETPESPDLAARLRAGGRSPAAIIQEAARAGDPLAAAALDLYLAFLAQATASLALTTLATGGVYIAGGVAPKLRRELEQPAFARAFDGQGELQHLLRRMPLFLVIEPRAALLGAAHRARRLLEPGEPSDGGADATSR